MKLYELILSDEEVQGIDAISVVGSPAMESQFIMLSEEKRVSFAKIDNEKQILLGVAMIPEKKIYRFDEDTQEEFNVFFSKETIKRASELYLKKGNQSNANLEHSKLALSGTIVESWIVEDLQKDKTALYGIDAPVGSWVVAMKIEDKEQWELCKENGTGFSIEGMFNEKVILTKNENNMDFKQMKDDLLSEFKTLLGKQVKLAQWKSADGTLTLETETDMPEVGGTITLVTPDGNVPAPIGEYTLADGIVISVAEVGVISEISTIEEEEVIAPVEELSTGNSIPDVAELKNAISSMLIKFNEDLNVRFTAIETKLSEQVKENETLKTELSATPAVLKTAVAPTSRNIEAPKTMRGRLALSLTDLKNKN
jgi:hypothetical protein